MLKYLVLAVIATALAAPHTPEIIGGDHKIVDTQADIIAYVNSHQNLWVAGENKKWSDHTWNNVKSMCGTWMDGPKFPEKVMTEKEKAMAPPAAFDLRTVWTNCSSVSEIRDQAACGSCWAFGAVESMSDRICIASAGSKQTHVSAQDMNSCCDSCGDGCGGGYPSAAWSYWQNTGVVTGANYNVKPTLCYPYTIPTCDHHLPNPKIQPCGDEVPTPPCTMQCVDGETWGSTKSYGGSPYSLSVSSAYTDIMAHGSIEASFDVYQDFLTYTSGVYVHTTGQLLGGHAVKILGWGTLSGVDYWIVANSWNPDWGNNGYFLIKRGVNECGIESGLVAAVPK